MDYEEELKDLLQDVGDSIASVGEQMLMGDWVDDMGNPVILNQSMVDLSTSLSDIMDFRHEHLGYSKPTS